MWGIWPYVACNQIWDSSTSECYWSDYQRNSLGKGKRGIYYPKPGDIMVFTDNGTVRSHTGMVYACDKKYVYTIEGNSGQMCRKRSYLLTDSYLYGWIRPNYAVEVVESAPVEEPVTVSKTEQYGDEITVKLHALSKGCAGKEVESLQKLLGIEADGIFGPDTESAVKKFQKDNGLYESGIANSETWEKLAG